MTGGVTMWDISRWTSRGGSYRTIQRFYNTLLPWDTLCWEFFRAHLFDPKRVYLFAGDESIVVAKLREMLASPEHPGFGVLDIKARCRALKYLHETLKILPQKSETIVIETIAEHLEAIGAIHWTSPQRKPG